MPKFKYDPAVGSFKGWLVCITKRKIANQFKKRAPWEGGGGGGGEGVVPEELPAPGGEEIDRLFEDEWRRGLVEAAMRRLKAKVKLRDYQIFDLSAVQQRSVAEVCGLLKVSAPQVYLARHRVGKRLKQEIERLRNETGERGGAE
jgi:RNA polymerase sigma-70 factor (ECF subfamily)